ncbi:tetratricopeptide repeat protein [candidate division WOR-3 bacterium]|nr:tetratricopeptide repeat protein [candidate division WOR-3 bacterium]
MAEVYEAFDTRANRDVALKLMHPHIAADETVRKRFLREARVGMELDHPGIVKVFEVGEAQGRPYMAMELVAGKTLEQVIQDKTLDLEQSIDLGLQITEALAAAHTKKIIHRDLKPRNIMVTDTGIKIMDFGLARVLETSSITAEHEIIGTLYYMSPEQAIGAMVDERSDVFSLGVVLYQMLAGRLPFSGDHPGAVIHAILYSDPMRLEELGMKAPLECEMVLFKMLKKKPQVRYTNAMELHSDLGKIKDVLQGRSISLIATEEVFEESPRGVYSDLIGREQEMAKLDALFEKMVNGESSTIFVGGEAGIGKSRLVWELGQKAKAKQVRYLMGRCLFGEKGAPYQPVFEGIRSYFKLKSVTTIDEIDAYLQETIPELSARKGIIQGILLIGSGHELSLVNKEQLWDTVAELLKIIARDRPLVLHIDDVHWADEATLNLLIYVSQVLRDSRVLFIGTYRTEELVPSEQGRPHPLQSMLERMMKDRLASTIHLSRLNKLNTKRVIDSVYKDTEFPQDFADSIFRETEGNPLFILEALKLMQDEEVIERDNGGWKINSDITKITMPRRITDVINNRLRRLSKEERSILDIAAVEGYSFHSDTICHCMGMPRLRVLRCLQDLETTHLLIHALEREYQFDHGKIQETIYESLIPELRQEYHAHMAQFLIDTYRDKDDYAGRISRHLVAAGKEEEALSYLLRAGRFAQKLYANEEALAYVQQGLDIVGELIQLKTDRAFLKTKLEFLTKRAEIRQYLAQYEKALDDYQGIAQIAKQLNSIDYKVYALVKQANVYTIKAMYDNAMSCLNQALSLQQSLNNKLIEAEIISGIARVHLCLGKYDDAITQFRKALAIQDAQNDRKGKALTLLVMSTLHFNIGEFKLMRDVSEEALKICKELDYKEGMADALHAIGTSYYSEGYTPKAIEITEQGLWINQEIGNKPNEIVSIRGLGMHYNTLGEYERSTAYFQKALEMSRNVWVKSYFFIYNGLGEVASAQGDYEQALRFYQKARDSQNQVAEICYTGFTMNNIAVVHFYRGDYEMALDQFRQALKFHGQFGMSWVYGFVYGFSCVFWALLGDYDKIRKNLNGFKRVNEVMKTIRAEAWIWIYEGYLNYLEGHYDDAVDFVQRGLKITKEVTREAYMIGESLILLARIEIARKRYAEALKLITEALAHEADHNRIPDVARVYLLYAQFDILQNDYEHAESHAQQSLEYAEKCGMKEVIWQAHHMLAKVHLKQKKTKQATEEMNNAKKVFDIIVNNLGDELKKIYFKRKEVVDFQKGLKRITGKAKKKKQ